jgi:hypothetical protein
MMDFAWLSKDFRAKKVASWWLFADKATQDSADLDALCSKAHIAPAEFIGVIAGVAFELRVDVSGLFGGIARMPEMLSATFTSAIRTREGLEQAVAAMEYFGKEVCACDGISGKARCRG